MDTESVLGLHRGVINPSPGVGARREQVAVIVAAVPALGILAAQAGLLRDEHPDVFILAIEKLDRALSVLRELVTEFKRQRAVRRHPLEHQLAVDLAGWGENQLAPAFGTLERKTGLALEVIRPGRAPGCLLPVGSRVVELHRAGHDVAALERRLGIERLPGDAVLKTVASTIRALEILGLEPVLRHQPTRGVCRVAVGHAELHGELRLAGLGVVPKGQVDDVVTGVRCIPFALVFE